MPVSQVLYTDVTLTNAQIKAIPSTPFQIVPAAGAGKIVCFEDSRLLLDATAGAYTGIGTTSQLSFHVSTWRQSNSFDEVDQGAFIDASKIHLLRIPPPTSNLGGGGVWYGDLPDVVNQPLVLKWNNDGTVDLSGGNAANSLKITLFYTVIDV